MTPQYANSNAQVCTPPYLTIQSYRMINYHVTTNKLRHSFKGIQEVRGQSQNHFKQRTFQMYKIQEKITKHNLNMIHNMCNH